MMRPLSNQAEYTSFLSQGIQRAGIQRLCKPASVAYNTPLLLFTRFTRLRYSLQPYHYSGYKLITITHFFPFSTFCLCRSDFLVRRTNRQCIGLVTFCTQTWMTTLKSTGQINPSSFRSLSETGNCHYKSKTIFSRHFRRNLLPGNAEKPHWIIFTKYKHYSSHSKNVSYEFALSFHVL